MKLAGLLAVVLLCVAADDRDYAPRGQSLFVEQNFWTKFKRGVFSGRTPEWRPKNVTKGCDIHDDHCFAGVKYGPLKEYAGSFAGEPLGHMQPMGNQGAKMTWMPEMDARDGFNSTEFYTTYVREALTAVLVTIPLTSVWFCLPLAGTARVD